MESIKANRQFMKANFKLLDDIETDQNKEIQQPPLEKSTEIDGEKIELPKIDASIIKKDFHKAIEERRSHRKYQNYEMDLDELGYLLWATQGVDTIKGDNYATIRTVPSGGARHPFETYIFVNTVKGLKPGIYRYLALSHQLCLVKEDEGFKEKVTEITLGQKFAAKGSVIFIWSCIPYRSEWRYNVAAHKTMLLDAGHLCQNLYLACEAIGLGTCAIAAYHQEAADLLLNIDGEEEFVVYMAPIGKV
ncbi:SagB/ThcOx family dehydrogenase [Alkaliphilus peptidifermentans]|uniref:SagB-type dehydrogenase domain-containing protein n=1 Tax=Alkaliphilus peptidifermentans DSM 18978 TaxID=1120976 RepID=A0A1G5FIX8_9FIRM|nr:SagB/ThcOx family dehydrogenase [Alkaliphilus peptidifermentans]SCY39074.1 SagB-type dehydrogenase domain-containing protein [Alkaliphilus peptidifermentans DSM 18978]